MHMHAHTGVEEACKEQLKGERGRGAMCIATSGIYQSMATISKGGGAHPYGFLKHTIFPVLLEFVCPKLETSALAAILCRFMT